MTVTSEHRGGVDERPPTAVVRRRPLLAVLVAALCLVPYGVGIALPYYANGLHHRPAGEPLYAHDLATLWPYDTWLGGVITYVTVVGLPLAPFVAASVAMWAGFTLWDDRRTLTRAQVALYLAAVLVVAGSIAFIVSTPASELITWFLD